MSTLRIVHALSHSMVTRGGAVQALLLARAQRELGHHVEVVTQSPPDESLHPTFDPWVAEGIPIRPFGMKTLGETLRYRAWLKRLRPDVVHAHRDDALLFTYFATLLRDVPAFVSQRGTTHFLASRTSAFVHRSPRVHRIIAVAQAVKDVLVGFGVDGRKIEVIYGSFDVDRFDPARLDRSKVRRELGLSDDQKLVVQVGQLHRKKAPHLFVQAAAEVLKRRPECVFALVGEGDKHAKCEKWIARLGLEGKVRMLGFRRDVPDVYAAADVAVNSSLGDEGLTGAIREALALEKPVVATRVDGNPEVVRPGETGILVERKDVGAMAQGILDLLDHPERARAFGAAGRRLILERMHPKVRVARTEAVYRAVLAERGAGVKA